MSSPTMTSSSARRRTFGSVNEPGLTEWTSKIRQLQQEVDEDVEAEQKRLAEVRLGLCSAQECMLTSTRF